MPQKKQYIGVIEKFYRRSHEDVGMYFWVESARHLVPAITIEQAIFSYFHYLSIDDFNVESAMATYSRIKKEFYEAERTKK